MVTPAPVDTARLRDEARQFGRYLVGVEPSEPLIERYIRANDAVFGAPPTARDAAVLAFARARPWAIPLLDAGAAITGRAPRFRDKLLVMMAILETTPEQFTRTAQLDGVGRARLALRLARAGAVVAVTLVVGSGLVLALGGRRGR